MDTGHERRQQGRGNQRKARSSRHTPSFRMTTRPGGATRALEGTGLSQFGLILDETPAGVSRYFWKCFELTSM
jgi:hypothetical protein